MYCPSVRGDLKNDSNEKILLSEGGGGGCVAEKRISFWEALSWFSFSDEITVNSSKEGKS